MVWSGLAHIEQFRTVKFTGGWMDGMGWDGMGWDISQTTRNARAPGGANKWTDKPGDFRSRMSKII